MPRGHVWGHQRSKSRILSLFFIVTTLPRLFALEIAKGNSAMDEDWRNAFGISVRRLGAWPGPRPRGPKSILYKHSHLVYQSAGICDGVPSTCSSFICIKWQTCTVIETWKQDKDIQKGFRRKSNDSFWSVSRISKRMKTSIMWFVGSVIK